MTIVVRSAAADRLARRAGAAVLIALAIPAVLYTGQFPPLYNANEMSRLASVSAFVETGSFRLDDPALRFGLVEDLSRSDGHLYSNKAPGLTLAAIPVYRALRMFFPRPRSGDAAIFHFLRLIVVTPICLVAVARFLSRLRRSGVPGSALVAAAVSLGTPFLFYSRSFFSHAWTASLLFLALDRIRAGEAASTWRRVGLLLWAAGLLAGWAAISEYPAALVAALLWVRSASRRAWGRAGFFGLGLVMPFALLLAYDAVCFGSPFVLSSAREAVPAYSELARRGLFGFGLPSPSIAAAYLLHPARGLLLFSPFWLWAAAGFMKWWRSGEDRADWVFCFAAVVLFFVAMTAYPNWHGGWSFGDRYLLPLLFPAGLALAYALDTPASRWGFAAAVVYAAATHELLASTWVHFPADLPWPAANGALWFVRHGWTAQSVFGAGGWSVLAPLAAVTSGAIALGAALAGAGLRRGRTIWAAVAGLVLFAGALALSPPLTFYARAWRAEIYGQASGKDPGFTQLRAVLATAANAAERERAESYRRRYRLAP